MVTTAERTAVARNASTSPMLEFAGSGRTTANACTDQQATVHLAS